jgi:hypothetical protein
MFYWRILTTLVLFAMLGGFSSPSHGNIIVFPNHTGQTQAHDFTSAFELSTASVYFKRAVDVQQPVGDLGSQGLPWPSSPPVPQPQHPHPRLDCWLAAGQGMGSPDRFQQNGGSSVEASLSHLYKFFLAPTLSWAFCGETFFLPEPPLHRFLKVPIC